MDKKTLVEGDLIKIGRETYKVLDISTASVNDLYSPPKELAFSWAACQNIKTQDVEYLPAGLNLDDVEGWLKD